MLLTRAVPFRGLDDWSPGGKITAVKQKASDVVRPNKSTSSRPCVCALRAMLATELLINIIAIRNTTRSEQEKLQKDSVFSS